MKNRSKKTTAFFVSMLLITSLFPATAMAEDEPGISIDNWNNETIEDGQEENTEISTVDDDTSVTMGTEESQETFILDDNGDIENDATDNDEIYIEEDQDQEDADVSEKTANLESVFSSEDDTDEDENYGITVAGTKVTNSNKDDVLGDGTVTYDPTENKLTLHEATLDGRIYFDNGRSVVLELQGNNQIKVANASATSNSSWIYAKDALTISGEGSLTIDKSKRRFINCRDKLLVDGVTLNFTMAEENLDLRGIYTVNTMTIENQADVQVEMNENEIAMLSSQYIDIQGSTVNLEGDMEASGTAVYIDESDVYVHAVTEAISARKRIYISDSKVTAISEPETDDRDVYALNSLGSVDIEDSVVRAYGCNGSILALHVFAEGEEEIAKDDSVEIKNPVSMIDSWVDCSDEINGDLTMEDSVLFTGNDGVVTGDAYVPYNTEIAQNQKLTVTYPARLTVPYDVILTNQGTIEAYCTGVRGSISGNAPKYTHAELTEWKKDNTSHWKECSRCGQKQEVAVHTYDAWKITKYPDVGTTGMKTRSCKICGLTQKENITSVQIMTLKAAGGKKTISLKWSKVSGADGYLIYGAKCGNKLQLIKTVGKNTINYKQKKLKNGTYYKYYVTAYKNIAGKKVTIGKSVSVQAATDGKGYGYARKITVKKSSFIIKKGKTATILATVTNTNSKVKKHTAQVRYISTNPNVATVTAKGKIKAKSKGSCYIYCYAMNGLTRKVKVRVK